jgi:hypothetical protein
MRSLIASFVFLAGCSAGPTPTTISEDAGRVQLAAQDGAADADAGHAADAKTEASVPSPAPSCPNVPENESSFHAQTVKANRAVQHVCSSLQIGAYYTECFGGDFVGCDNWYYQNEACYDCIADGYDPTLGPTIDGVIEFVNVPGCLMLAANETNAPPGSCAEAYWNDVSCIDAACSICPVVDSTTSENVAIECLNNALVGTCKPVDDAATAACATDPNYSTCMGGSTSMNAYTAFTAVAAQFCGE